MCRFLLPPFRFCCNVPPTQPSSPSHQNHSQPPTETSFLPKQFPLGEALAKGLSPNRCTAPRRKMEEQQQKEDSPCGDFSFRLPSPTSDQIPGQVNESSGCGTVEAAFVSERALLGPHTPGSQATRTHFQTPSHQRPDVVDFFTPPLSAGQGRYDSSPKRLPSCGSWGSIP